MPPVNLHATLDGLQLPIQFSYELPSPVFRQKTVKTINATRTQRSELPIDSDRKFNWSVEAATVEEYAAMVAKAQLNLDITFVGYWGDQYVVRFADFTPGKVASGNVTYSGIFEIASVTSEASTS